MNQLIPFYLGKIKHPTSGLSFSEMLDKNDIFFLGTHNWITWFFPSKKRSCSLDSIIATEEELAEFHTNMELRRKLILVLQRVLSIYGFAISKEDDKPAIVRTDLYNFKKDNWLTELNPNQKRIARILQSLMLVKMKDLAEMFFQALFNSYIEEGHVIESSIFDYWRASIEDPAIWKAGGKYGLAGGW
jgi:hypothetical protein